MISYLEIKKCLSIVNKKMNSIEERGNEDSKRYKELRKMQDILFDKLKIYQKEKSK